MVQACMQDSFFIKPRKFSGNSGGKSCRITLQFPLLQLNLEIITTSLPTQSLCFLNYSSDVITASQIRR